MARDVRGFPLIKMTALRRAWSVKSAIGGGELGSPVVVWKRAHGSDQHGSRFDI